MKMKRTVLAAAAAVAGTWVMPSAAIADPAPPYVITQCSESTCYVYECSSFPNVNDSGYDMTGWSMTYSYPRPREVSGD